MSVTAMRVAPMWRATCRARSPWVPAPTTATLRMNPCRLRSKICNAFDSDSTMLPSRSPTWSGSRKQERAGTDT